jgi:RsbT co-antagonist protein rsbRD N-terminal domain
LHSHASRLSAPLIDYLTRKRSSILASWLESIHAGYPSDKSQFLKKQKNRFANPVGYTIAQEIEAIFDCLLAENDSQEEIASHLDPMIRMRSIQNFSPSQAIDFIFNLKEIVRKEVQQDAGPDAPSLRDLLEFESKVDKIALSAFEVYVKCREKIFAIRADEVKRSTYNLLRRANFICETTDEDSQENAELSGNVS